MTNQKETVGSFARQLRTDANLTQPQLAELADVSIGTLHNIEGDTQVRPKMLTKIYRECLKVPDDKWHKLVGLWVAEAFTTEVPESTLREISDSARIQETSAHEERVARFAAVLPQLPEKEQDQLVRFCELLIQERQIFGTIQSFLEILNRGA